MDKNKALLVITRTTRVERESEAVLAATATGIEQAIENAVPITRPTDDSILLLTNVIDISARILKYLTVPEYANLQPTTDEGYFIVWYPYRTTDITAYDFQTTVDVIDEETLEVTGTEQQENITKRTLRVYTENGSTDTEYATDAEVQTAKDAINASDGYAYLFDARNSRKTLVTECRPPLWLTISGEPNPFIVPELQKKSVIAGRTDNDRN